MQREKLIVEQFVSFYFIVSLIMVSKLLWTCSLSRCLKLNGIKFYRYSLVGLLKVLYSCMDNKKTQRTGNTGIYKG